MQQGRIFLITLAFGPNRLLNASLAQVSKTSYGEPAYRILVPKPYPLNLEENFRLNLELAKEHGYWAYPLEQDGGAGQDFNRILRALRIKPEDYIIPCDHDAYPKYPGWIKAMQQVLDTDPKIDWVSLWTEASSTEFTERGGVEEKIADHLCYRAITPMMVGTSMIRGSLLLSTGGLIQPCPMYGGVELGMWPSMQHRGTKQVFLRDYEESQHLKLEHEDPEFRRWKHYHVIGMYPGSFTSYVEAGSPVL